MNHTSPPSSGRRLRRLGTIAGGIAAGATAVLMFATPALACAPTVQGKATCDTATGEWIITWNVASDINRPATITKVTAKPELKLTNIVVGASLPAPGKPPLTDVVRVAAETVEGLHEATLTVTATWPKQGHQRAETITKTGKAELVGTCEKPSPSPSASPAPSAPASSPAAAPSASTSPAAGGGGSLPVTGSSVGAAVGISAGLLAIGAGLFFFFRRRRIRFTA